MHEIKFTLTFKYPMTFKQHLIIVLINRNNFVFYIIKDNYVHN